MPKRSLNPGNNDTRKIERLNQAVEAMLARTDGKAPKVTAGIEPLVRIAAGLRDLPRESFKAVRGRIEQALGDIDCHVLHHARWDVQLRPTLPAIGALVDSALPIRVRAAQIGRAS